ncbi:MAG: hypothetical protein MUP85_17300, partial [Candidatus Lokiarchaeota archaeon]|nr:hypothetical protein [Candidatus Lokiarchaeota archaeon]
TPHYYSRSNLFSSGHLLLDETTGLDSRLLKTFFSFFTLKIWRIIQVDLYIDKKKEKILF